MFGLLSGLAGFAGSIASPVIGGLTAGLGAGSQIAGATLATGLASEFSDKILGWFGIHGNDNNNVNNQMQEELKQQRIVTIAGVVISLISMLIIVKKVR